MSRQPEQIPLFGCSPSSLGSAAPLYGAAPRPAPRSSSAGLRLAVLGSGSGGNSLVIETASGKLLVDAGFSSRELVRRLRRLGIDPASLDGVLLTHEHGDHCRGAVRLARRFSLRVHASAGTARCLDLRAMPRPAILRSEQIFEAGGFSIEPFAIPHDALEPLGYTFEDADGFRVGVVSDLGARTPLAWSRLRDLDVLVLETNHDLEMLRNGPYPWALKQRVAGRRGHLSNDEAAAGVAELVTERLRCVVLYHLSATNNLPALAVAAVGEALERVGSKARVVVTEQERSTGWIRPQTGLEGEAPRSENR